tara:strand:- start:475 stop:1335 length:861 start_codon:yes stop_codon:yes gene_type:complete
MSAAIASVIISGTSSLLSFSQANAQRKAQQQAENDADAAMAAARGKLDVNFAEQQAIKKEAYDSEREALLVQGAQAINAGVESERGAAATAGRVYAGQQAAQAAVRSAQADEMTNIEGSILEEESRLRDLDVSLDLEEVAGNQLRAYSAQQAGDSAFQQGIQGAVNTATSAASSMALYRQDLKAQQAAVGDSQNAFNQFSELSGMPESLGGSAALTNQGGPLSEVSVPEINKNAMSQELLAQVQNMSSLQFNQWKKSLSPADYQRFLRSPGYAEALRNNVLATEQK